LKTNIGKYIYCFIETERQASFGAIGIGNQTPVTTIHFRDLAAVVSDAPLFQLENLSKDQLQEYIGAHQAVNEQVMRRHTMIPMKFGNIAENEMEVRNILEHAYIQFKTLLHRIKGKVELIVQASINKQDWIMGIASTNDTIIELQHKLSQLTEEQKLLAKIAIGKIIHESVTLQEKVCVADVLRTLRNGGHHFALGRLLHEEMIFNGSFLVDKKDETEFDGKVQELAQRYQDKVKFRYIGPLPPMSFVNLKLETTDFDLIDQSRKLLGLPEKATMSEMKSAYRKLAASYHPDRNQDDGAAEKKFIEIAEAFHVIETFCQNYRYSFSKENVADTVLVHEYDLSDALEGTPNA